MRIIYSQQREPFLEDPTAECPHQKAKTELPNQNPTKPTKARYAKLSLLSVPV